MILRSCCSKTTLVRLVEVWDYKNNKPSPRRPKLSTYSQAFQYVLLTYAAEVCDVGITHLKATLKKRESVCMYVHISSVSVLTFTKSIRHYTTDIRKIQHFHVLGVFMKSVKWNIAAHCFAAFVFWFSFWILGSEYLVK